MKHLLILIAVLSSTSAIAHDPERPELNKWFDSLTSGLGLCCSGHDGVVINEPDWESKGGSYRVRIDGKWLDVPPSAILKIPNLSGQTMAWPYKNLGQETIIRCFIVGTLI